MAPPPGTFAKIDLTTDTFSQDLAQWTARCPQNTAGKPITDLTEIEPFKAVVLALAPNSKQWQSSKVFPTLINATGQPKYLVCLFQTWTLIGDYTTSDNSALPGYREDWKITVQDLDTKEIYETKSLVGHDPADDVRLWKTNLPITEIVGGPPLDEARSVLLAKQSIPVLSATISVPYNFPSIDFAPDSQSLYFPVKDGYRKWDFTADMQTPLSFQSTPANCGVGSRAIRTSFDGKYLATTCYIDGSKFAFDIWAADTLQQTARFDAEYFVDPQFELQEQKRIVSFFNEITTLDLSTGEVQSTPLKLEGTIDWVSPQAKYAITDSSNGQEYQIWDLAEPKILQRFENHGFRASEVSRDGRLVFSENGDYKLTLQVRDVQSNQPLLNVIADGHSTYHVSPNGRLLAVLTEDKVAIIDLKSQSLLETIPVKNPGRYILFSPDAKKIALPDGMFQVDGGGPIDVVVFGTGLP